MAAAPTATPPVEPAVTPMPAQGVTPEVPQQTVTENWQDWLQDDAVKSGNIVKNLSHITDHKEALNEAVKQLHLVQPLIGKGAPEANAPDAEILQYREMRGSPKAAQDYQTPELKTQDGQPLNLPSGVEELVRGIAHSRRMTQSDYDSITQQLAENLAAAPEVCKQELESKYGALGADTITKGYERAAGLLPQEMYNDFKSQTQNSAVVKEAFAKIAERLNESTVPTETIQQTQMVNLQAKQKQAEQLRRETVALSSKNRNDPGLHDMNQKLLEIEQEIYNMNNQAVGQKYSKYSA